MSASHLSRVERLVRASGAAVLALVLGALTVLLVAVVRDAAPRLTWAFLTSPASPHPEAGGLWPALVATAWLMGLAAALALPLGVGTALYLEEYVRPGRRRDLIDLIVGTLAGVPSIVYGLMGAGVFVYVLQMGRSLLAGASTLALLLLPMVVLTTREALRAVPHSTREASLALGATRWQTLRHHVLPQALPGMLAALLVALARAIGETAPLVVLGTVPLVPLTPHSIWSPLTALPVQAFAWIAQPHPAYRAQAAASLVVLLVMCLTMHLGAIWLRGRTRPWRMR